MKIYRLLRKLVKSKKNTAHLINNQHRPNIYHVYAVCTTKTRRA